jgi:hypothetical protein
MDNYTLFEKLLYAETEDSVDEILDKAGYLEDEKVWYPFGGFENNFAAIGNQQSNATGALVEKIINGIDAVLMAECYVRNIDPESDKAPKTMTDAVERFFNVRDGRLENLLQSDQSKLADNIHLVAVGSKENPNYLIIDRGEGQTPARFPDTFVSLLKSNKIRIPFVQGKFNSGGTGILSFCGDRNYQLIISRRRPGCPIQSDDDTADLWGFTIVRRLLPSSGRRSSMYVYLAPDTHIPSFKSEKIKVLPGKSGVNRPALPYAIELSYGTCIKLYNYKWREKSIITTSGRYELEEFLHSPCMPFRVTETREYRANYYSATVIGGWTSATAEDEEGETRKLEDGFPAFAILNIKGIGELPYQIAVFKSGTKKRHVPYGIFFIVNGQVHGEFSKDFISRKLKLDYLKDEFGPLLVSVDCTAMNERVREDFFMASRDRIRKNEVYSEIEEKLADALKNHPGLQEINQNRRKQVIEAHLQEKAPLETFQRILDLDPTLSSLFAAGDNLATSTGPGIKPPYVGRKFPTFFRLSNEPKDGLIKLCPINRTCKIEFETDAMNDYFTRAITPGKITFTPIDLIEHTHLWNGKFETRVRVPWNAQSGDAVKIRVNVTDIEREARDIPFISTFTITAAPELEDGWTSGPPIKPRSANIGGSRRGVVLATPKVNEVHKGEWSQYDFNKYNAIKLMNDGQGGYDCYINVDNAFLLTELSKAKENDKPLIKFWFCYGLVLAGLGIIRHQMRLTDKNNPNEKNQQNNNDEEQTIELDEINKFCDGLAQVIVPIIRTLYRAPGSLNN